MCLAHQDSSWIYISEHLVRRWALREASSPWLSGGKPPTASKGCNISEQLLHGCKTKVLLPAGLLGVKDQAGEDLVSLLPLSSCSLHAEESTNPNQGSSTTSASQPCWHDDDKGRRGEPVSLISCRSLHFSSCCPCLVSSVSLICSALRFPANNNKTHPVH